MGSTPPPAHPPPPATADDFIPTKKRRICDAQQPVQNQDRISTLPDDILIKILSLMKIREAAITDCLSTRWRHIWENIDNLILDKHNMGMQVTANSNYHENPDLWNSEATKFVQKVNGLLHHYSGDGIKKFKVEFPLTSAHASELDYWVAFASASSAEKITIYLNYKHGMVATQQAGPYNFPLKEFADVSDCQLRFLSLSMCSLETVPANLNGFSYLKSLLLHHVSMVDAVVLNIMSCCRALCLLSLRKCNQLIHLRTSNAQLTDLEVSLCKSLISICIHAENLQFFSYKGHKVDIEYEYAPILGKLYAHFVKKNECPLDCIGALPVLQTLLLQFPSRLQVSRVLQQRGRFADLKKIMLYLLTSWKKSILSVAYLLETAPLVETLELEVCGNVQRLSKLNITWPKDFTAKSLSTIRIGGFSGEQELLDLLGFLLGRSPILKRLLIDTHRSHYQGFDKWKREKCEDSTRSYYARGVAWTHLAPKVPSTVGFRIR